MRTTLALCLLSIATVACGQSTHAHDQPSDSIFDFGRDASDSKGEKDRSKESEDVHVSPTTQPADEEEPAAGNGTTLDITARIDGSDVLVLSREGAQWTHKHWGWPKKVAINETAWSPKADGALPSTGDLEFLKCADFSRVKVLDRHGRDTVAMERSDDRVTIYFADSPNGAADYEIKLLFAPAPSYDGQLTWAMGQSWHNKSDASTTLVFRPDHTVRTQNWGGSWKASDDHTILVQRGEKRKTEPRTIDRRFGA